jgi:nucleoside-diphosphate-sugar epimerase
LAKTLAERRAWSFQEQLPEDERFDLVVMNPGFVQGPVLTRGHCKSSPSFVRGLMMRSQPACPRLYFSLVDVRDVALAHVEAFERPEAKGRYVLTNGGLWMREMAQILALQFPDHPVPTLPLPDALMYVVALFNKQVSFEFLRRSLGKASRFDGSRAPSELGFAYRPLDQTLIDTAQSFIDLDLLRPRRRK